MNGFTPDLRHYGVVALIGAALGTVMGRTFGSAATGAALYTLGFWLRGRTSTPALLEKGAGLLPLPTFGPGVQVALDPRFSHTQVVPASDVQPQVVSVPASDVQRQVIDVSRNDVQPQIMLASPGGAAFAPFPSGANGAV